MLVDHMVCPSGQSPLVAAEISGICEPVAGSAQTPHPPEGTGSPGRAGEIDLRHCRRMRILGNVLHGNGQLPPSGKREGAPERLEGALNNVAKLNNVNKRKG